MATEENRPRLIHILLLAGAVQFELSRLESLPAEVLLLILNKLNDDDLNMMCATSKVINDICNREEFWHNRYDLYYDIPVDKRYVAKSWKTIYVAYATSRVISFEINNGIYEFRLFNDMTIRELFQIIDTSYNYIPKTYIMCDISYSRQIMFGDVAVTRDKGRPFPRQVLTLTGSSDEVIKLYLVSRSKYVPTGNIHLITVPYINSIMSISAVKLIPEHH